MKPLHRFYENRQEANGESMIPVEHQPTDDLRTRIAAVLQNHRQGRFAEWMTCSCDGHWSRFASAVYDGHVADAVIRELEADYILVPKGHTIARIRSAEKLGLTGDGE